MTRPAPLQALLVCQAGPGIGLGHLARALRVASSLRRQWHANVRLLVQAAPFTHDGLQAWPHRFVADSVALMAAMAEPAPPGTPPAQDLLLLDLAPAQLPPGLPSLLASRQQAGRRSVAIDGLLALRPLLDLVFLPSMYLGPEHEAHLDGPGLAPVVWGWDCLLVDRPDPCPATGPTQATTTATTGRASTRVLVLTGGSDATGLGQCWPTLLDGSLPAHAVVDWVQGPFAQAPQWPPGPRLAHQVHVAPQGLAALMAAASFAVTVFGVSCFELLALGVPTVVFSPYGQRDRATLEALARSGAALVASDEHEATTALTELMHDPVLATRLSATAKAHMAVDGAQRLSQLVGELMAAT